MQSGSNLAIQPVNRVEHYFHFLFDLCLPLWHILEQVECDSKLRLKPFGIFSPRLAELFPGKLELVECSDTWSKETPLPMQGLNPQFTHLRDSDLARFKRYVDQTMGVDPSASANKIVLIERMPPNDYFKNQAVKKGAGASRRSIPNHHELAEAIHAVVKPAYQFVNVRLEELSFCEQIRLFDQAAVVIGQHGAGLANCLWSRESTKVVEISHRPDLMHFRSICDVMGLSYGIVRTTDPHEPINVDSLIADILKRQDCGKYFLNQ